mmetsp:Transcript_36818/g.56369  ORF Transcript_36818/g.56369 Transcript_36818/m.56369 type:complete len:107 (+) Transcript_36818:316-636(+)
MLITAQQQTILLVTSLKETKLHCRYTAVFRVMGEQFDFWCGPTKANQSQLDSPCKQRSLDSQFKINNIFAADWVHFTCPEVSKVCDPQHQEWKTIQKKRSNLENGR